MKKSQELIAKLLAAENITLVEKPSPTASFDLSNRTLCIPNWDNISDDIRLMMITHEVSHALNTPLEGWHSSIVDHGVNKTILNIVEDARIERLITKTYPGLKGIFAKGYKDLIAARSDFFGNIESLKTLDALNTKAKLRHLIHIEFDEQTQEFFDKMHSTNTFEEVVDLAKEIQEWLKSTPKNEDDQQQAQNKQSGSSDAQPEESQSDEQPEESQSDEQPEESQSDEQPEDEFKSDLDDILRDFDDETEKSFEEGRQFSLMSLDNIDRLNHKYEELNVRYYGKSISNSEYKEFLSLNKKSLSVMINEFNRKKSANQYKKNFESKTGELDLNKIHSYKTSEDIFLRNSITPDSVNHGMIILLDYSASMNLLRKKMFQQAILLAKFCQKVGVDLQIIGFTTYNYKPINFEFYNSKSKNKEIQLLDMFNNSNGDNIYQFYTREQLGYPISMSGTPTIEATLMIEQSLKELLRSKQKQHFVLMTDGSITRRDFSARSNKLDLDFLGKRTRVVDAKKDHWEPLSEIYSKMVDVIKKSGISTTIIHMDYENMTRSIRKMYNNSNDRNTSFHIIKNSKVKRNQTFFEISDKYDKPYGFDNAAVILNNEGLKELDIDDSNKKTIERSFKSAMVENKRQQELAKYFGKIFA